jgi:LPXTG-motif cell wall-anchored protein
MFSQSDVDKRGVRIMREGKPATIADFRSGDQLTATIVTSKPPRVVSEKEVTATLAKSGSPSPGAAPPAAAGAQPAATAGATPPAAGAPAPPARKLPKTASPLPLLGVAGLVSLVAAAALRRRRVAR